MLEVRSGYPWNGNFVFDDVAEKAVGRAADFSGCGFGERELGWFAKSHLDAERIKRSLQKVGMQAKVGGA